MSNQDQINKNLRTLAGTLGDQQTLNELSRREKELKELESIAEEQRRADQKSTSEDRRHIYQAQHVKKYKLEHFTETADRIADIKRLEEFEKRRAKRKIRWNNKDDRAVYENERREKKRWNLIHKHNRRFNEKGPIPDSEITCRDCGQIFRKSHQWVVPPRHQRIQNAAVGSRKEIHNQICCRGCWERVNAGFEKPKDTTNTQFLRPPFMPDKTSLRIKVNADLLEEAREELHLSKTAFAGQCGWSQPYQSQLENGDVDTISIESANKILTLLNLERFVLH